MKPATIEKSGAERAPGPEQLEKLNRLTRRPFGADEVYVFSLILCDNEIDRDGERFTLGSLKALEGMFVGKTGIFDHSPTAKNQSARIFDTALEELPGEICGEGRARLRAWAYMLRTEGNRELIAEIDGGIKKEVSVGCAVESVRCSVCGADMKNGPCAHEKGKTYGGEPCHHVLENPTDAYEWSFVAVPAQRAAGVTKRGKGAGVTGLDKLFEARGGVTLSPAELAALETQYKALARRAAAGDAHLAFLRGQAVRLFGITRPELSPRLCGVLAEALDLPELEEVCKALSAAAAKEFPPVPQLAPAREEAAEGAKEFMI